MKKLPCGTPYTCDSPARPLARLLLAHGAGAGMQSDFMLQLAQQLVLGGVEVVRFEFPYMAKRAADGKKRLPDKTPVLLDTWHNVIAAFSGGDLPFWIGGKSLGGRMATIVAVEAESPVRGVAAFGYPFHPPKKPEQWRTEYLPEVAVPVVILQGTRDPFGKPEELAHKSLGPAVALHWLESGDHDFVPLKRSGRTQKDLIQEAANTAVAAIRARG